jgi:hypothetical protein
MAKATTPQLCVRTVICAYSSATDVIHDVGRIDLINEQREVRRQKVHDVVESSFDTIRH